MIFKGFTKKKQHELPARPFAIDTKQLTAYSAERLKDYVLKYERYTDKIKEEYQRLKEEYGATSERMQQLELNNKELSDINEELNGKVAHVEFKESFFDAFRRSIKSMLHDLGLSSCDGISANMNELKKAVGVLRKESDRVKRQTADDESNGFIPEDSQINNKSGLTVVGGGNDTGGLANLNTNESVYYTDNLTAALQHDPRKLLDILEALNTELGTKMKVLSRATEGLENDFDRLIKSIEGLYLKIAHRAESNLCEKYNLDDLLLVSKDKLNVTLTTIAQLKRDMTKKSSELKTAAKSNAKLLKENTSLATKNAELEENVANLRRSLNDISVSTSISESQMPEHMRLLKLLQEENYKLNMSIQDLSTRANERDASIDQLKERNEQLEAELAESDNNRISALRQERMKLDRAKRELETLDSKCKGYEQMLRSENEKYENLYKKYKDLNQDNYRNLKQLESLKKASQSLETKNGGQFNSTDTCRAAITTKSAVQRKSLQANMPDGLQRGNMRSDERERYIHEIEDLKFRAIVAETYLATERNVFDQLLADKNAELASVKEVSLLAAQRAERTSRLPHQHEQECERGNLQAALDHRGHKQPEQARGVHSAHRSVQHYRQLLQS